jgi:hypothetical protein
MYRSTTSGLLGMSRHELPPVVEQLEAVVVDMWVRTEVGAVHRTDSSVLKVSEADVQRNHRIATNRRKVRAGLSRL